MSAATPAACATAAEVPPKLGKPLPSVSSLSAATPASPQNVVSPPPGATISGFCQTFGVERRFPLVSKRRGVPPIEE
jgi:hypothetical protein